jgi:tetratricopeptide (TPR) repeat protein
LLREGRFADGLEQLSEVLARAEASFGAHDYRVADVLLSRGAAWQALGEGERALEDHTRARKNYEREWGPAHPESARALINIAAVQIDSFGQLEEGERSLERARSIIVAARSRVTPALGVVAVARAKLALQRGDFARATVAARRALDISTALYGLNHPSRAVALNALGVTLFFEGELAGSRDAYEQALALQIELLGPAHPDVGLTMSNLGETYLALGVYNSARVHLENAVSVIERALGPMHENLAYPLKGLGQLHLAQDDPVGATASLRRALAIMEGMDGEALEVADMRWSLARALVASSGSVAEARRLAIDAASYYDSTGASGAASAQAIAAWTAELPGRGR